MGVLKGECIHKKYIHNRISSHNEKFLKSRNDGIINKEVVEEEIQSEKEFEE